MADGSKIEWTDATWQPVTGCSVVSPGCTNCYAMQLAGTRLRHHPSRKGLTTDSKAGPVWNGEVRFNEQWLMQPLGWKRPRQVFVCAHGDLFHENVPDEWIDRVFAVMSMAPHHTFQVLTKRSARMRQYVTSRPVDTVYPQMSVIRTELGGDRHHYRVDWPLPNVWLGISAEDQRRADERIPDLLQTPAAVRFVSLEPLLGAIDLTAIRCPNGCTPPDYCNRCSPDGGEATGTFDALGGGIGWVIAGGESGPRARPMHPDWPRTIRDDCAAAGVPFFFKQWGEWAPVCALDDDAIESIYHPAPERNPEATRVCKVHSHVLHVDGSRHRIVDPMAFSAGVGAMTMFGVGKKRSDRLLDGRTHDDMPQEHTR